MINDQGKNYSDDFCPLTFHTKNHLYYNSIFSFFCKLSEILFIELPVSLIKLISHKNIWMKQTHSHAFFFNSSKGSGELFKCNHIFFSFLSFFEMYQHLQFIISFIFIFCLNVHSMYYYTICKKKNYV